MLNGSRSRLISGLLVPVLGTFAIQGSLEIVHPVAEQSQPGHSHEPDAPTLCDAALLDAAAHPSHYCLHLNAFSPIAQSAMTFDTSVARASEDAAYETPPVRRTCDVLGRAPPHHC